MTKQRNRTKASAATVALIKKYAESDSPIDITRPKGVTGLSLWGGRVYEEYLTQLKGNKAWKVYQQMEDDPVIGALLDALKMPLIAAEFSVEPASIERADIAAADFLQECMDDMVGYTWRQHVLDMLDFLTYGFSLSEMVFKKRMGANAEVPSQYKDGKMGLQILDPRGQETVEEWKYKEGTSEIEIVRQVDQYGQSGGRYIDLDYRILVHATFRMRKRNPQGRSVLRALYTEWYRKIVLQVLEGIGIERDMAGLPVITLPFGATSADADLAEAIVRNIRVDEEAGVVLPPPPIGTKDAQGWKLELLSGAKKAYNTREVLRDIDTHILMRFFAQFLKLGMDKSGTQALVAGSQEFFTLALKSIQEELLDTWNNKMVPMLFKLNPSFHVTTLPKIAWASASKRDAAMLVNNVVALIDANVITVNEDFEDWIRGVLDYPDRPEGIGEGEREPHNKQGEISPFVVASVSPFSDRRSIFASDMNPSDWADLYKTGQAHWAEKKTPSLFAQEFVKEMKSRNLSSILEIGCGNGRDCVHFAKAGLITTGIDATEEAIALATSLSEKANQGVVLRVARAEEIPFASRSFDAVFTLSVLHSTDVEKSMYEISRVLKEKSLLFIYLYLDTRFKDGTRKEYVSIENMHMMLKKYNHEIIEQYTDIEPDFDEFGEKHMVYVVLAERGEG